MDLKIAVLPGDGIGPEIIEQAIKAIDATCKKYGHTVGYTYGSVGATPSTRPGILIRKKLTGFVCNRMPYCSERSGIPVSTTIPKPKSVREQGLLEMRKKLGLYANLRPVSTFKSLVHRSPLRQELVEGADFICIRELTGGIYFRAAPGRSEDRANRFRQLCIHQSRNQTDLPIRFRVRHEAPQQTDSCR